MQGEYSFNSPNVIQIGSCRESSSPASVWALQKVQLLQNDFTCTESGISAACTMSSMAEKQK